MFIESIYEKINDIRKEKLCSVEEAIEEIRKEKNISELEKNLILAHKNNNQLLIDYINNHVKDSIDIYINGWDGFLEATLEFYDDENLSEYAINKYKEILFKKVVDEEEITKTDMDHNCYYKVFIEEPETGIEEDFEKLERKVNRFVLDLAGYCDEKEFEKLFDKSEPEKIKRGILERYNILLDDDMLGACYKEFKEAYYDNLSYDEFIERFDFLAS